MISFILIWIGKQITFLSAPRNLAKWPLISINLIKSYFSTAEPDQYGKRFLAFLTEEAIEWSVVFLQVTRFFWSLMAKFLFLDFWQLSGRKGGVGLSSSYVTWTWARLETIICQKKLLPAECFADCKCILRTLARHFMHSEILGSLEEQLGILKYSEEQNTFSHAFKLIVWAFMPTLAQVYWIDVILISSLISVSNYSLKTSY